MRFEPTLKPWKQGEGMGTEDRVDLQGILETPSLYGEVNLKVPGDLHFHLKHPWSPA